MNTYIHRQQGVFNFSMLVSITTIRGISGGGGNFDNEQNHRLIKITDRTLDVVLAMLP